MNCEFHGVDFDGGFTNMTFCLTLIASFVNMMVYIAVRQTHPNKKILSLCFFDMRMGVEGTEHHP